MLEGDPNGEPAMVHRSVGEASSQSALKKFVRDAPVSVAMFDRKMRYVAASDRWLRDCDLPQEVVTGKSHYELLPNLPEQQKEQHRRGLAGETVKAEESWQAADGTTHTICWDVQPWGDRDAESGGIIIFREDITSEKFAQVLRTNEEYYRSLFDNLSLGIAHCQMICDDAGRPLDFVYLDANPAFLRMTGLQSVVGKRAAEVVPGLLESYPEILHELNRVASRGGLEQYEREFTQIGKWISISAYGAREGKFVTIFADITERKLAEETLRHREELLQETGRMAHVGGWEIDPITGVGAWTDEVARIHDVDPARPISAADGLSFYVPESRVQIDAALREAVEQGRPYDLELEIISAKGVHKWVRTIGHPVSKNGKVVKLRGSFQDITERKHAEEELQYRNLLLTAQQEVSIDGILIVDEKAVVVSCNHRFAEMWGIPKELIDSKDDRWILPFVARQVIDTEGFVQYVRHLYDSREISHAEVRLLDGRVFERYSAPLFGTREQFLGRIWYFHDITKLKRAEEELRASEAKFRSYVNDAPFAVVVADEEGTIVDFNPKALDLLGYDAATLRSMKIIELHLAEDRPAALANLETLRIDRHVEGEFPVQRQDGRPVWVSLSAVLLDNGFSLGFFNDITGRKTSEEHVRVLEEQFRQAQKMEAVGRLAGGIAHDFNNLLMVIMAQTELLSMELGEPVRERVESIMSPTRRGAQLTRQLLAFSRKQTLQPTVTTLNQIVSGISEMLQRMVGEDVDVRLALDEDPWPVKLDRSQFEQVLMNLAVNARDAMPGGGRLTLETKNCEISDEYQGTHPVVSPGKYVLLAVSDNGSGMTAEVKLRVFEPFYTTKAPGKGTGLGLSMVYGIVKQSNGFIWVYSELGAGSTFKIYLPKADLEVSPKDEKTVTPPLRVHRNATILLVEDDESLREVMCEFLQAAGHKVLAAESMKEACAIASGGGKGFDVVLTDVVLRGGNGTELVRKLQEQPSTFKVVYMSGYTADAIVHHGVLDAGTLFLQKPFSRATLLNKIEEALSQT